jgi:site-specific DNA recombinase
MIRKQQTLLKSNFHSMLERYRKDNLERIEKLIKSQMSIIEQIKQRSINASKKLISETDLDKKKKIEEKIFSIDEELELENSKMDELLKEKSVFQTQLDKANAMNDQLLAFEEYIQSSDPNTLKDLIVDMVYRIDVSAYSIEITFKHPYLATQGVYQDEVV